MHMCTYSMQCIHVCTVVTLVHIVMTPLKCPTAKYCPSLVQQQQQALARILLLVTDFCSGDQRPTCIYMYIVHVHAHRNESWSFSIYMYIVHVHVYVVHTTSRHYYGESQASFQLYCTVYLSTGQGRYTGFHKRKNAVLSN